MVATRARWEAIGPEQREFQARRIHETDSRGFVIERLRRHECKVLLDLIRTHALTEIEQVRWTASN